MIYHLTVQSMNTSDFVVIHLILYVRKVCLNLDCIMHYCGVMFELDGKIIINGK